jgi:hypothetical protein
MSPSSAPPLPKPPVERTFVAAVTVLGLVAVAQLIAVVVALAPEIRLDQLRQVLGNAASSPQAQQISTPAQTTSSATAGQPDAATVQQANSLLDEAGQFRQQRNFRGALEAVTEADRLVPNKPGILIQMASAQMMLGDKAGAAAVLQRIVALPAPDPADAPILQQARAALAQLGTAASSQQVSGAATPAAPSADQAMRDEVGIPIGSTLGIVDAKLANAEPGYKALSLSTKANPSTPLDAPTTNVKIVVHFYEQNDHGDIVETDSRIASEWVSSPIDWANGDIELLKVKYRMPGDRGDLPAVQYYGYVVGVYYKGELQDQRADPVSLLDQFPLKVDATDAQ